MNIVRHIGWYILLGVYRVLSALGYSPSYWSLYHVRVVKQTNIFFTDRFPFAAHLIGIQTDTTSIEEYSRSKKCIEPDSRARITVDIYLPRPTERLEMYYEARSNDIGGIKIDRRRLVYDSAERLRAGIHRRTFFLTDHLPKGQGGN